MIILFLTTSMQSQAYSFIDSVNTAHKKGVFHTYCQVATHTDNTSIGVIKTDIEVPGLTTYKDISLESRVLKQHLPSGEVRVDVDIFYSNAFLKKAYGTYHVVPLTDNKVLLCMNTYIKFGWFFDLFITNRRYKNLMEFRIIKFMNNMSNESEKRMKEK